jgi:hypothetical protein
MNDRPTAWNTLTRNCDACHSNWAGPANSLRVRDRIEQAERWLARIHLAWWLAPPSVLSAIAAVFGYIQTIPFGVIMPWLIAAFTVPLLAISLLIFVVNNWPVRERPNLQIWRTASRFRLRVAACLFANIAPFEAEVDRPGEAHDWMELLDQAWKDGELERVGRESPGERVTTRESLREFAMKHGQNPAFLD